MISLKSEYEVSIQTHTIITSVYVLEYIRTLLPKDVKECEQSIISSLKENHYIKV